MTERKDFYYDESVGNFGGMGQYLTSAALKTLFLNSYGKKIILILFHMFSSTFVYLKSNIDLTLDNSDLPPCVFTYCKRKLKKPIQH